MLKNFFKLNEPHKEFAKKDEFIEFLENSKDLRNYLYRPDLLDSRSEYNKYKIDDTTFTNVSFSKTTLKNIIFIGCNFVDCLFIGTKFEKCEFHNCTFRDSNLYKADFEDVYVNPDSFKKAIPQQDNRYANIAVYMFKQLYLNSRDQTQSEFARKADFQFRSWTDKLIKYKHTDKLPYPISNWEYYSTFFPNQIYKWLFGYGLRLRNFVLTFFAVFGLSYITNYLLWPKYNLKQKDILIETFQPDSVNHAINALYTMDVTTKLVDSQIQPTSITGMNLLALQSIIAFILLTGLITILVNKFVK